MSSEEDKIYCSFAEFPLAPLQGAPTYDYMIELNVYLNSCSSSIDYSLGCGSLRYLVLTAQPSIFTIHCGTAFIHPTNPGIHSFVPIPAATAAALTIIVRYYKHNVLVWKEYNAVDKS